MKIFGPKIDQVLFRTKDGVPWKPTNIKLSFVAGEIQDNFFSRINLCSAWREVKNVKRVGNIVSIKSQFGVFVIFSQRCVNVTGVRCMSEIEEALLFFARIFPSVKKISFKIQNIFAGGKLDGVCDSALFLPVLKTFCREAGYCYYFHNLKFPGFSIRTAQCTMVVFPSGSINLLGLSGKKRDLGKVLKNLNILWRSFQRARTDPLYFLLQEDSDEEGEQ